MSQSSHPTAVAVGDFNGDGKQDVVTANGGFANNSLSVLMGSGTGTLNSPRVFMAGQSPVGVAAADFNSDGILDVVAVNKDGPKGTISLLRGNGDGSFVAPESLSVSTSSPIATGDLTGDGVADMAVITGDGISVLPGTGIGGFGASVADLPFTFVQVTDVAIRDVNGDQKRDLIATSSLGASIFLGNGDGTFGARADFPAGTNVSWVTLNDFNGDGKLDAVVANNDSTGSPGGSILLGNGDGTFNSPASISTGGPASFVETGDFNRDGKSDLTFMHGDDSISVLFGVGNGTFGNPTTYSTRPGPGSIGVGDFNRDGKPDLAVSTFFGVTAASSSVKIFTDKTGGNFGSGVELATDSLPIGVVVTDFNGDGKLDLAVGNKFGRDVYVFNGNGDGTFQAAEKYVVGDGASWLASADFNSDGKPDIAVANSNSNTITLLQTPASATHFRVNVVPDTTTAGAGFTVVVSALDSQGRLATNFTGPVHFTSSDARALLPANYTFTAANFGVKKFAVTLKTAGTQSVTATSGALTGSDSVAVTAAGANHIKLTTVASTTAGTAFDLTVTALDLFNNVATGYRGTVHFTSTAAGAALPPDYAFQATDDGAKTFSIALDKAGLQTVNAKDKVKLTLAKSASLTVVHDVVSGFKVSGYPTKTARNVAHPFTVTAVDAFGNTVTDYAGTVHFGVVGGTASLPPDFTFATNNKGRHIASATFLMSGAGQSLTVTDVNDATLTGTESGINVT